MCRRCLGAPGSCRGLGSPWSSAYANPDEGAGVVVSALILTHNESLNLPRCLAALTWCDDVVVLDSYSTDTTPEIARAAGARVVQRPFDDYATQRNFGLHEIDFRHDWVLMLDADEVLTDELRSQVWRVAQSAPPEVVMYLVRRKDFYLGRWLRHASGYPTWFARLMRPRQVRVERAINERYLADGGVGRLSGHLLHYPFAKGMSDWISKHNRYSSMEAELIIRESGAAIDLRGLVARDPVTRRKAQKALVYRFPARPLIVFLAFYLLRGGILDGMPGLRFCLLRACYELMISCKVAQARSDAQAHDENARRN
jgi:glycosyltransferase involved in cell wall biosynthesis